MFYKFFLVVSIGLSYFVLSHLFFEEFSKILSSVIRMSFFRISIEKVFGFTFQGGFKSLSKVTKVFVLFSIF